MNYYNKYSKKPEPEVVEEEVKVENDIPDTCIYVQANVAPVEPEVEPEMEPEVEPETEPEENDILVGVVEGCKKLNVRAEPYLDAEVISVVEIGKELMIDEAKSTNDWYSVCTASGAEGFCMKKFITIKD